VLFEVVIVESNEKKISFFLFAFVSVLQKLFESHGNIGFTILSINNLLWSYTNIFVHVLIKAHVTSLKA